LQKTTETRRVIMDKETRKAIVKIQNTLIKIDNKQPVFFNITTYQNKGLVYSKNHYCIDSSGNRVIKNTSWHLTPKAKQLISVFV
jgi:hypothetical protein